jgi:hypothetical protein
MLKTAMLSMVLAKAAEEKFSPAAGPALIHLWHFRQTELGTRRAAVNLDLMLPKIVFRFKLGLLDEVHCPLFSAAVASE